MSHKILIVDDNRSVRYYIRRWIEANTPCQVCGEAENGQVAVEMVTQLNPHIVILDFQMPVMNGLDAARQISSIAPTRRSRCSPCMNPTNFCGPQKLSGSKK